MLSPSWACVQQAIVTGDGCLLLFSSCSVCQKMKMSMGFESETRSTGQRPSKVNIWHIVQKKKPHGFPFSNRREKHLRLLEHPQLQINTLDCRSVPSSIREAKENKASNLITEGRQLLFSSHVQQLHVCLLFSVWRKGNLLFQKGDIIGNWIQQRQCQRLKETPTFFNEAVHPVQNTSDRLVHLHRQVRSELETCEQRDFRF